ncbi:MAG: nucleotide exchange factor GrpE [Candidatus Nealsonbacteria bacterium]|nr:nucleotide exchange factor GrpE [Candidatus Nealsonbacteria bacterium]
MDKQRNKKLVFGESKTEEPSFAKATAGEEKKDSEDLKKQMEECEKKRDDYLKGWQRSQADFINYKKEEIARMKEILKYGGAELILTFLPILDNFEKAEKETPKDFQDNQYFKGLLQIKKQIQDFLKNQGIKEIESVGKKVDLNLHEIVGEVEMKDKESGTIIEETQKGYLFEDKLLRVAKVKTIK